jgi:peptide deformylase
VAIRPVLRYPHPALKAVARDLDPDGDAAEIERVAADLVETMRSHPGCVGLAATQLGELVRLVCVDVTGHRKAPPTTHGLLVLVNPVVVASEGSEVAREGCLSIPHLTANVRRATRVVVASPGVEPVECEGFEARCILHELDHLDGFLFLDRVDSLKTDVFPRKRPAGR